MTDINDLELRLKRLEKSVLQIQRNTTGVTSNADTAVAKVPQVDANTEGVAANAEDITDTQIGLADTYEEMDVQITQVEEALAEVYELVVG